MTESLSSDIFKMERLIGSMGFISDDRGMGVGAGGAAGGGFGRTAGIEGNWNRSSGSG